MEMRSRVLLGAAFLTSLATTATAQAPYPPPHGSVVLAESCVFSPSVITSGDLTVAVWNEAGAVAARVGPGLAALGPRSTLWGPGEAGGPVALLAQADGFVAAASRPDPDLGQVMAFQRFGLDLLPRGGPVVVDVVAATLLPPQLAALPDGRFLVAYEALVGSYPAIVVRARLFGAEGAPLSAPIEVGSGIFRDAPLSLAVSGDRFALAWAGLDGSDYVARLRVLGSGGELLGGELQLGRGLLRVVGGPDAFLALRLDGGVLTRRSVGQDGAPAPAEIPVLGGLGNSEFLADLDAGLLRLVYTTDESRTLLGTLVDTATWEAGDPTLLASVPDGLFLEPGTLEATGDRFLASWQLGEVQVILPDPCQSGLSVHAGLFGGGPPVVEVPTLAPAAAWFLAALLAAAGLAFLRF